MIISPGQAAGTVLVATRLELEAEHAATGAFVRRETREKSAALMRDAAPAGELVIARGGRRERHGG
ncbi:hypothetical protein [Planotetraspora mira]|uniref:hypothetical protein n=1 Tax=Planotetraspora mira TaxID=58121 RepID=UPI001951ED20|nr:hypothetical protein [Planotetraspora mira]